MINRLFIQSRRWLSFCDAGRVAADCLYLPLARKQFTSILNKNSD